MQLLKQSTASQEILLGPFLDETDGKTAETALTILNTDIKLRLGGGTAFTNKNSGGATHIANGYYYAVLDATDTGTQGLLEVCVNASGALPVRHNFTVIQSASYAAMVEGSLVTDATLADAVWDEATSGHATAGTTGKALTDAQSAGNPWTSLLADNTTAGSMGAMMNVLRRIFQ